jgi:undecaprenyl diphosphate synthase
MKNNLPMHVAIIPDGNRRWADMKGLPHIEGHRAGANRMHDVVDECIKSGIKYLTVWGFSSENWKRTDEEIQSIFSLLELWIVQDTRWLHENGVRLRHIGRFHELPQSLQRTIAAALYITKDDQGMTLNLAFNYSGRAEIIDAIRLLIHGVLTGTAVLPPTEEEFPYYLYTNGIPDVDLVIRTAGEFRISNFMLWQTAYSEYYFCNVFWPDFDKVELEKAFKSYQSRERRFGGG